MVSNSRECVVCLYKFPVVFLRKAESTKHGEETDTETVQGPGHDLQRIPPDSALKTCSKNHCLDVCYSCLDLHVKFQLELRGPVACNAICCPTLICHHIYTFDEIKKITTPTTFSRYDDLLLRRTLNEDPNFRWCLRPGCPSGATYYTYDIWEKMGCEGEIFDVDPRLTEPGRWIKCPNCGFDMCFVHQVPCRARSRSKAESRKERLGSVSAKGCALCRKDLLNLGSEKSTEEWIAKNTKRCPRPGCGVLIEKGAGCSHLTCTNCDSDFCWDCLGEFDLEHPHCLDCEEQACRNDQDSEAELLAAGDIHDQAVREYDYNYERAREKIRMLEMLGVFAESEPLGFCDAPGRPPFPKDQPIPAPTTGEPAQNITEATHTQPDPEPYNELNYLRPRAGPSPPTHGTLLEQKVLDTLKQLLQGTHTGLQAGSGATTYSFSLTQSIGYAGSAENEPVSRPSTPVPEGPTGSTGPLFNINPDPLSYHTYLQDPSRHRQGYGRNNNQGRGQENVGDPQRDSRPEFTENRTQGPSSRRGGHQGDGPSRGLHEA